MAPSLVLFLFAYATVGTWVTTSMFGQRLMQLTYAALRSEGDFRFALLRTRENSGKLFSKAAPATSLLIVVRDQLNPNS